MSSFPPNLYLVGLLSKWEEYDECLRMATFYSIHADFHGSGANLVRCEHSGDGGRRPGNDECEVTFPSFVGAFARAELLDVTKNAAGEKAHRRDDGTGNFFE